MSKQTNKSRYPSLYSQDKFVTASQYIIELVCEKKAQLEKTDLPPQFWKLPAWQAFYKSQLRMCHKLLKEYDEKAVIKALRNKRAYKIKSLFAPWLVDIIKEEQYNISDTPTKVQEFNRNTQDGKPRQSNLKDNTQAFLRNLDD